MAWSIQNPAVWDCIDSIMSKMDRKATPAEVRNELLERIKSWKVVSEGALDTRGGDWYDELDGHDPFIDFLASINESCPIPRPPGNLHEAFSRLGEPERKRLIVEAGMAKIKYRKELKVDHEDVLRIDDLPEEFQLSAGAWAKELRDDFLHHFRIQNCKEEEKSFENFEPPEENVETRVWDTLEANEIEAAAKLKEVLDELVEVACIGPELMRAYENYDVDAPVTFTCEHATRALTPFLPLCSDKQLGRLAKLLGCSDEGRRKPGIWF
jgi:hypothetical protein